MKRIIYTAILFIISTSSFALNHWSTLTCNGFDTAGNSVYLVAQSDSPYVNINGDILRIVGKTRNGLGVVTEDFIGVNGVLMYDSIVPTSYRAISIYQFNSITEVLMARADLVCTIYSNSKSNPSVFEQNIFKNITKIENHNQQQVPAGYHRIPKAK